jgi:hypothetical protein
MCHNPAPEDSRKEKREMKRLFSVTVLAALAIVSAAAQAPDASGRWDALINAPDGAHTATLTLEKHGEALSGTIAGDGAEYKIEGTQKGPDVTLAFTFPGGDGPVAIALKGKQDGDTIAGEATFGQEPGDWSAKRAGKAGPGPSGGQ